MHIQFMSSGEWSLGGIAATGVVIVLFVGALVSVYYASKKGLD